MAWTVDDQIKATEGVECSNDKDVIDEPPPLQDIDTVMAAQADLVEAVHTLGVREGVSGKSKLCVAFGGSRERFLFALVPCDPAI